MPGNDNGDRLHNFFLQDNSSSVQHHQQIMDDSWSVVNNNLYAGNPPQFGVSSANTKIYNHQQSETDRGQSSHTLHRPRGLNVTQPRSEFSNDITFGSRVNQTRQEEATISSVDTVPDQYNFVSRGLSMYESHQGIPQHQTKPLMRSGTSESPVSFDLFGNQQQMQPPQFSMLHLQQQQSGYGDMHPLQQQLMLRKMQELQRQQQELQRQQQVRQLDNSQQNAVNPFSSFANQSSGGYPSALANSSPNSDSRNHHWGTRIGNMNWQHHASPVMQGSSNGLVYSSNDGQAHRLMDSVPQQTQQSDQSLYGVPVSGSRGNVTQFPQRATEKPLVQHLESFTNSLPGNQYTSFSEQSGMQDESLVSRQRFPGESSYERPGLTIQQENSGQRVASPMETHQEVSNSQSKAATLQNEVSLDPTEERILFGSDDNIFSDFCKNPDLSGDGDGPFDSFQNGTWSALMQSAVAETSSSDIQQQDELCGLSSQNTSVHPMSQHPAHSGKQGVSFHSDMPSSLNISAPSPDNDDNNSDYSNVLGVQQVGSKLEHERLQGSSFQRDPRNMSNHGSLKNTVNELRPMHENASHSLDTESNTKNISGPWASTQGGPRREYGMSNGWNTLGSVAPAECEPTNNHGEKSLQHSQGHEQKEMIKGGVHGGLFWNSSSMPNSSVDAERAKSVVGNIPAARDGYSLSNFGSPNLSNTRYNEETSQHSSSQGNYWKNVNPMVKSFGGESMEGSQHHIYKENRTVDSSLNSRNMAEFKSSQRETHKQKGNSKDSYTSNLFGNNPAGGMKEAGLSDVSDSHSLPSRNQNLVNQIGDWKTSGPPKFQFHPMGDFEEGGPQYGVKQSSSGQVNTSQIPESSVEMKKVTEKEHPADKNDAKNINNTLGNFQDTYSSQNMLELLDKVDHSRDHGLMMHSSPSGHNVLSEKHERDDSGGAATHLQRSQSSNSQGFGLQLGPPSHRTAVSNQHFLSQSNLQAIAATHQSQAAPEIRGNGQLQLPTSPAGQSLPFADERIPGELKRKRSGLAEQAINNSFMHKLQGNLSSASNSGISYSSQSQYLQHMARTRGQVSTDQHDAYSIQKDDLVDRPSIGQTSQNTLLNASNVQHDSSDALAVASQQIASGNQHSTGWVPPVAATEPVPAPLHVSLSGSPQHGTSLAMPPNMWSNVPVQPNLFNPQIHKTVPNVPQLYPASVLESSSPAPHREAEQDAATDCESPSVSGASSMNRDSPFKNDSTEKLNSEKDGSPGVKPVSYNHTDGSQARTSMTQKDIEAFGRSLTSNNLSHQHYSLLSQVQAMKSADPDTNDRALKKMKGLESSVEGKKLTPNAASRNVGLQSLASSGDSGIPGFSGLGKNAESKTSAQFGNVPAQNVVTHGQEDSRTNLHGDNSAPPIVDHPHISPQMAPSWFNRYGTFRNGQMLARNDSWRATIPETAEQPFTIGKSATGLHTLNSMEQAAAASVIDPGQHLNIPQSSTISTVAIEPESLQLNIPIHKKRKRQAFCYSAWHKEVSQKSQTPPQTIRMAEEVWAKAVNRIPEMIEDEVDLSKNVTTTLRAKRRLTSTTHLMQQLLRPPMPSLLSSDAESACEGAVYNVSRLALGEACGLVSNSSSDFDTCHDGVKLSSDKKSEKLNDRHLSVVMEDLRGRARNLETEFFRLDKRVSLADLRVECQELEKFSVINRFAKFHGRGQPETPNTSSSPDVAAKSPRPYLQRYVTALPVPRSLPDRVHCLPL